MKTYLYVLDTMSDWEAGYLLAELNSGRFFRKDRSPVSTVTVGSTMREITTMGGIRITPDMSVDSLRNDRSCRGRSAGRSGTYQQRAGCTEHAVSGICGRVVVPERFGGYRGFARDRVRIRPARVCPGGPCPARCVQTRNT